MQRPITVPSSTLRAAGQGSGAVALVVVLVAPSRRTGSVGRWRALLALAGFGAAHLSAKRSCQRRTVGRLTPMVCATRCAECRIRRGEHDAARSTCLRGRLRSAAIAANCSRSAVLNTAIPVVPWLPSPPCHGPASYILTRS